MRSATSPNSRSWWVRAASGSRARGRVCIGLPRRALGHGAGLGDGHAHGEDAGAAGGVTNVAHQLRGSLGLGLLVAVFAAADSATLRGSELLAHRIGTSLTLGAGMLGLALVIALVVRPHRAAEVASLLRQDHIRRCH
jgi:hypothetical protein